MKPHITRTLLGLLLAASLHGQVGRPAPTGQGLLTLIDFPDAISTQIWGVNGRGEMAGVYTGADRVQHGFLYANGRFTTIDYPGAAATFANAINASGDIAGDYAMTSNGPRKGFLWSSGRFTTIEYPDGSSNGAVGIDANGDIAGYHGSPLKGYLLRGGEFTSLSYPEATVTVVGGMGPSGLIVGAYTHNGVSMAFAYSHGEFERIWTHPQAVGFTNAVGANAAGEIVGRYLDAARVSHGYLWSGGAYYTIDCPTATFTGAAGITPDGDVVGRCTVDGVSHGFLLKRGRQPRYRVTDLGTLGGQGSVAFGISNSGAVAGFAAVAGGEQQPFLWRDGRMTGLGGLGGGNGVATNPTNGLAVPLASETARPDPLGADFCGYQTHRICLAAIWRDGRIAPMPTLGGNNAIGFGMNERGQMVGLAEKSTFDPQCPPPQKLAFAPVIWDAGVARELRLPAGDTVGFAVTVNERGDAAGGAGNCSNTKAAATGFLQSARAVLWENGVPRDLGHMVPGAASQALGINNRNEVVGASFREDGSSRGFVWNRDTGMTPIDPLDEDTAVVPTSINNARQTAGASCDAALNCRAILWERGATQDLNQLAGDNSPLYLAFATWINDIGEIVGFGFNEASGELRAFLASPVRPEFGSAVKSTPNRRAQPVPVRRQSELRRGLRH